MVENLQDKMSTNIFLVTCDMNLLDITQCH